MLGLKFVAAGVLIVGLCAFEASGSSDQNPEFKKVCLGPQANAGDDLIDLAAPQILKTIGFEYEIYLVTADDGYITQLIRLINPYVDPANLRSIPVMIFHGGSIDPAAYVSGSSKDHHPEKWPRVEGDGYITSSNRSLPITLSNNGYDVWLVATRGSNKYNYGHTKNALGLGVIPHKNNVGKNMTEGETKKEYERKNKYWQYGQDDITAHELKNQFDKVLSVTGASELSVYTYSLSTPMSLAFFSLRPDYAQKVRLYLQMGPAITASHFTSFSKLYFEWLCNISPTRGNWLVASYSLRPLLEQFFIQTSRSKTFTYTVLYEILQLLFGPSPKYQTFLERNILGHIWKTVSFKEVQQYCQNSVTKKLNKFNYGTKENIRVYGQSEPPAWDTSNIQVQNWAIIYGTNDALASPETVQHLIETVKTPKPPIVIAAQDYNHLDLIAAVDVDKKINLPVLEQLNLLAGN